jgi:AcrR family transcriptional regulator
MVRRPRTAPRKKPRQERSHATVAVILSATARVLCSTGYDRASTNRIALAAGVSVGSLYQYFPSKEALVAALVEKHTDQMMSLVKAKLADVALAPLPVAVRTMIEVMFDAHAVDPKLHKVLIEQVPRVGRLEKLVDMDHEIQLLLTAYLQARASELRRRDVGAAAIVLVHLVESVTHHAVLTELPAARCKALSDELTDMVLRYLLD